MSDRGFGDHASKNIVKNPLLSTAVIGVSLEDLTHNAVLLPAVPSQELVTRQDEQIGTQARALGQPEHNISNLSSGDSNSNLNRPQSFTNINLNPHDSQNNPKNNTFVESRNLTLSQVSVKTEDDFDVNEYFARLQGTRYVSAPLNSAIKEEQNTNLGAEEENLEEINLNDPDKTDTDIFQQSITADIAQNFSQLPTVLPQVASAVFSSFSNMLSMKSREQNSDVWKPAPDSQDSQQQPSEDIGVPLMSVPGVAKEVAPPPKEPPILGTASNYRITTRKKMYAQIPGLRSGDTTQNIPINSPPTGQTNVPHYFTPENYESKLTQIKSLTETPNATTEIQAAMDSKHFELQTSGLDKIANKTEQINAPNKNLPNVSSHLLPVTGEPLPHASTATNVEMMSVSTVEKKIYTDQSFDVVQKKSETESIPKTSNELEYTKPAQPTLSATTSNISVIPPPPMFSNLPKPDSQSNVRSVLPPSIARRISASNPVIKTQAAKSLAAPLHNIFVPASDTPSESQNQNVSNYVPKLMSNQLNKQVPNKTLPWETQSSSAYSQTENITPPSIAIPSVIFQESNPSILPSGKVSKTLPTENNNNEIKPEVNYNISQSFNSSVIHLSHLNTETLIANPQEVSAQTALPEPISSQIPSTDLSQNQLPSSVTLPPPPLFFNPNSLITYDLKSKENRPESDQNQNISLKTILLEPLVPTSDPVKNLSEPPKISSTYNYRMTNKRPQYYSGPIEGFGSISNNIKPTIDHIQPSTFQGALYTPEISAGSAPVHSDITLSGQSTAPFDITQPSEGVLFNQKFDITQKQNQTYLQPEYNTAFDLSRQTTEFFESSQESKGFGIIGSLKSKLSSIDINKIQNTVTTFFDPALNNTKMEATSNKENVHHNANNKNGSIYSDQFTESQNNNLEIYVPNVEPASQSFVGHSYQMAENTNIINTAQDTKYYAPTHYSNNCFDNTNKTYLSNDYISETLSISDQQSTNSVPSWQTDFNYGFSNTGNIFKKVDSDKINDSSLKDKILGYESATLNVSQTSIFKPNMIPDSIPSCVKDEPQTNFFDGSVSSQTKTYVDLTTQTKMENDKTVKDILQHQNIEPTETDMIIISNTSYVGDTARNENIFSNSSNTTKEDEPSIDLKSQVAKEKNRNFENTECEGFKPATDLSCVSLFSQPVADNTDSISDFKNERKNVGLFLTSDNRESYTFEQNAADFFDRAVPTEKNLILDSIQENENDLNICETCREVNKHGDKEAENLTDQLIENITAPIQLSNPVEVPLTESNIPNENRTDFEPDQCAEISHITEETIETIQVQAATELLDDIDHNTAIIKNYGWCTDDTPLANSNPPLEHDYTVHPDGTTTGFFQNKSLIFDNIPTNASDEIKAEYKSSFDDTLTMLPRQMSIPSAPPPEDDTKSDESGLDVHSIEQDAKKDFPIFEEYLIEPSETDDDKIEFKEREKSLDDSVSDTDTFTSRVEKFKKMEETIADHNDDVFETNKSSKLFELPTSSSPSITIASYFDTGNYAVENHYRNSLTSPSNLSTFQSMSQSSLMRVPPGFEDEFQRKLSLVSNDGFSTSDKDEFNKFLSDPASQGNLSTALTTSELSQGTSLLSSMPTETIDIQAISPLSEQFHNEPMKVFDETSSPNMIQSENKLPEFSSVFGIRNKEHHADTQETSTVLPKIEPENVLETLNVSKNESVGPISDSTTFFTSDAISSATENSDVYDFSRLSSYFSTATQADASKSFFELSQSQNHYRQGTSSASRISTTNISVDSNTDKSNVTLHQNQQNDKLNIPHETYVANLNLIRDLTSATNIDFIPKEQIVRTVNFFTVVYDNDSLNSYIAQNKSNKAKSDFVDRRDVTNFGNELEEVAKTYTDVNRTLTEICSHCCNIKTAEIKEIVSEILGNLDSNNIKFKKIMDNNDTDTNKDINVMESKNKDSGERSITINVDNYSIHEDKEDSVAVMSENRSAGEYSPVKHHWFYCVDCEDKSVWKGFSSVDSTALENAFLSPDLNETTLVPTNGGRFDVNVVGRIRMPVYWSEKPTNVLRCSWFYKGTTDARYVPYPEAVAQKLEEEYKRGITTGEWHRRLMLPNNELVVMHGPAVMVHFLQSGAADAFSSSPQSTMRPRVVRRGCDESEIEDSEPSKVDHLLLMCHGVGSACDMRFRPVEEVVDDFRTTSLQLLQSHYKSSCDSGVVGRVEVLPVSWHGALHAGAAGVDRRLARLTLHSIPRLRSFTNDTVLDVLFYTSPVFCQIIMDTVCNELNRIYSLFKTRNPDFSGGVSLGGHSLGSVILYDLLCHQEPLSPQGSPCSEKTYVNGTAGTGQPTVKFPRLEFKPDALYALGSPIAIFECIRGVELLGPDFCLPTCKKFFNIFHPYDPIAYRIEPLINPLLKDVMPFQIPHHKGRKRMHLELKDTMARVGADIKQKLIESIKSTWSSMWKTQPPPSDQQLEKVVEEEMEKEHLTDEAKEDVGHDTTNEATADMLGKLNEGRRIDYVLQEAPFEMINEYIFAMSSHVCYWESEDTMLLILREIYAGCGLPPDGCVPQHGMTLQRTRVLRPDDSNIVGADYPSTSRGGV